MNLYFAGWLHYQTSKKQGGVLQASWGTVYRLFKNYIYELHNQKPKLTVYF